MIFFIIVKLLENCLQLIYNETEEISSIILTKGALIW